MPIEEIIKCFGLVTQNNPLGMPKGSLVVADNAVIRRDDVIESRRGYLADGSLSGDPSQLMSYSNTVLIQYDSKVAYRAASGTYTNYTGSYSPPSGYTMRSVEAASNVYVTTASGVQVFQNISGTQARLAGVARALDISYAVTGATGFLQAGYQTAYRSVIEKIDLNMNVIDGYPSSRTWVTNTASGSRNVVLTTYLPNEVVSGDIVQFYRGHQVSGTASDTAGDELGLVYQQTLSSSDISAGFVTFTDSIVDTLIGASLYTDASQEGLAQGNDRPPLSKDIALYNSQFTFFSNTSTKQRLFLSLVGTSGLSGNTITLAGVTYNFAASEVIGTATIGVSNTGVAAVDIDLTARSLVRVVNRYTGNTRIYAYYLSSANELPGQILFEERGIGASAYTIQSSNTTISAMFFPPPPVSPSTNTQSTSTTQIQKNGLYYSKQQQLEAVPAINFIPVGPANKNILRIAALRDSLIIIKEEGVYRLTGNTPSNFNVLPLDLTVFCKATDSVDVLSNNVFMLSNQGVVSISDSGVEVVSRAIEPNLLPILAFPTLNSTVRGFAYESEHSYFISLPRTSTDTTAVDTYVYNVFTRTWTRWEIPFRSALVEPSTDQLFFSKTGASILYKERKDFQDTDFADPEYSITITSISGLTVVFTFSSTTPQEGWAIQQGTTSVVIDTVETVSTNTFSATLIYEAPQSWTTGAAFLFPNVGFDIEWNAWSGGAPALMKHVRQVNILTDNIGTNSNTTSLVGTFRTDLDNDEEEIDIDSSAFRWGSAPWGTTPWGGRGDTYAFPTYVPRNKQYCRIMNAGVTLKNAMQRISLNGIAFVFEMISERTNK